MKCPKCKKGMKISQKDNSYGESGNKYTRTIYVCKEDDVWITVESPEELKETKP